MKTLAQALAVTLNALRHCETKENMSEPAQRHRETIRKLCQSLPSGAGFDEGTKLDETLSTDDRLVFRTSFHHMNNQGTYDSWTEHTVTVEPSFAFGFSIRITGRDRNQIKEYIHENFAQCLGETVQD